MKQRTPRSLRLRTSSSMASPGGSKVTAPTPEHAPTPEPLAERSVKSSPDQA